MSSLIGLLKDRIVINPFPNDSISGWSKLKEFTDNYFRFAENGGKFSKMVENIVADGEIARY